MLVSRWRCAACVMARRICIEIRHAVFLLTFRSRDSCSAESPFFAFSMRMTARNHFWRGRWVWWKMVPTVTLNEVLQA